MALVLKEAVVDVQSQTGVEWIGSVDRVDGFDAHTTLPVPAFLDVSYVDDVVIATHGFSNMQVQDIAQATVEAICRAAGKRGLLVNFEAGKTEMVWKIRGAGSRNLKQTLAQNNNEIKWREGGQDRSLRVVPAYKHLGTWIQTGGQHAKEVKAREAAAMASWGLWSRASTHESKLLWQPRHRFSPPSRTLV